MEESKQEMPKYKCHKEVWALKISAMEILEDGSVKISPKDEGFGIFQTKPGWVNSYKGDYIDLGYYILYKDGYASWSPTKAFEEGYTKV